ncbi:hypothetical protein J3B02_001483 [Coemansia erecta]|uniref:rRNA methyltransferase 1, mitochondrial n=1 Tax=Coemansia asiatica TaxID=1052880 RepID=A0A9W8CHW1_9FUNG|nr:hypothetical protein LPJ64_005640 [Coemansia asiatica]KAJ2856645.1 hypothetical protein J3B02_001483 [Coemansia erecta]KAJ2888717.1 hypothetical protein FB639_000451 [Coemansia asiatica]
MLGIRAFRSIQQTPGRIICMTRPPAAAFFGLSSCREKSTSSAKGKSKDKEDNDQSKWISRKKRAKRAPELGLDIPNIELVYGIMPVTAAIKQGRRDVHGLYVQSNYEGDMQRERLEEVIKLAEAMDVMMQKVPKRSLDAAVENTVHQGLVLKTQRFPSPKVRDLGSFVNGQHQITFSDDSVVTYQARGKYPLWLCLDGIQDSHNLGSIIRSALYFGVDGIILCGERFCRPTPAVSKASAGAMECMNVFKVTKIDGVLSRAKSKGWTVVCTTTRNSSDASSVAIGELGELGSPTVLVLGSEDRGISDAILDLSDINVHISAQSETPEILDSLNVNVAASILLSSLRMSQ